MKINPLHTFYNRLSLKKKLLFSYVILIVIPLIILGLYSYYYFSNALFEKVIVSSQKNNVQIVKNIDIFLTGLLKISEFPSLDDTISNILKKDYSKSDNKLVEILKDTESANTSLYKGAFYMNEYIGSVTVIPHNMEYKIKLEAVGWNIITIWECELKKEKVTETLNTAYFGCIRTLIPATSGQVFDTYILIFRTNGSQEKRTLRND